MGPIVYPGLSRHKKCTTFNYENGSHSRLPRFFSFPYEKEQYSGKRNSILEFPTRKGTDNPGLEYEKEIAALLAVRYAFEDSVHDFWIATNVDCVGDTDDVILCLTLKSGDKFALLIQLKHENPVGSVKKFKDTDFTYVMKDGKRDKAKNRFSVDKYFQGYQKLQEHLKNYDEQQPKFIQYLRTINKFAYFLYTNRELEEKLNCLVDVSESVIFNHLNTSQSIYYGFKAEHFNSEDDFLQNLYLFPNQISIEGVFNLIKAEIRKPFGSHKFAHVDFNEATRRYLEIIKLWTEGCELEKETKYITLSKGDVINILSDILLESYKCDIEECRFSYYDCPQKHIWNKLMRLQDISIVYGDELTLQFLKDYIGSEVKLITKKQGRYWKTEVAKLASNAFYEPILDHQVQIMKLCGNNNNDCISMISIYKFMWFYKNLPLLLNVNDEKDYNDILKILTISKYDLKVIVITNKQNLTCRKINQVQYFSSLKDLDHSKKLEILNFTVQFQGRISVPLLKITEENMYEKIKCDDIIRILSNNYNIGNKFTFHCNKEYHIERSVSKMLISFEALSEIKNELFLIEIENIKQRDILVKMLDRFEQHYESQICILETKSIPEKLQELKTTDECFHRLLFHEDFLEWKESFGSVDNIAKFQIIANKDLNNIIHDNISTFLNSFDNNKLQIISACPGMGKSVLIDYVSCHAASCIWIIPVTLRDIVTKDEFEDNVINFFEFYMDEILSKDNSVQNLKLSEMVFQSMLKTKKILLLLDGFDEISVSYKTIFSELITFFQKGEYPVLLTTREHMAHFLENKFNILSRTLISFTWAEQQNFLINFFKSKITVASEDSNVILVEFVKQLLNVSKQNLSDQDQKFTGIPLQLKLLANNFLKECEISINKKNICIPTKFDLLDLYEKFIKGKTNILCQKYGAGQKDWLKSLEESQYLSALQYLFNVRYLTALNIPNYLGQYHEDLEYKSQLMQKEGILMYKSVKDKISIEFIHRTFAEYLVAKWLIKNLKNSKLKETVTKLVHLRFEDKHLYIFLFAIFDRMLAKKCTLHLDIIYAKVDEIKSKLKSNPNIFLEKDETNRTAFHMLGLYANDYIEEDLNAIMNRKLFKNFELHTLDNLISYSALDYALLTRSWNFANKLCELSPYLGIKNYEINYVSIERFNLKYKSLYLTVFHNILCRGLLAGDIDKQTEMYDISKEMAINYFLPNNLYNLLGCVTTVDKYLQRCKIQDISKNYYYDVRFAIAYGSRQNIEDLLSSEELNINEKDVNNGNTLLHYATIHKRDDIAEILLNRGANVNLPGRLEATVVHYAASGGYNNLVQMYINSKAHLNSTNFRSQTALDVAVEMKQFDVAKTLLKQNSVITKSKNLLHNVIKVGNIELLEGFLKQGFDVNEQTYNKETPLHIALRTNRSDIAKILIDHNCDYKTDTAHNSLLHLAAAIGDLEILNVFLNAGLNLDKQNKEGETPLMMAIEHRHFEFAYILITNNANVHIKSKFADVFSTAILSGNEKIIHELISRGCNVNQRNSDGNTHLLSTLRYGKLNIVKILLPHSDLNVQNNFGYNALHYTAKYGYQDLVVELLAYDVDVNKITVLDNDTALLLAFKYNFTGIAKLLISAKADVNVVNKEKMHSLHYAVMFGDISIVQDLITSGAKLNIQNNKGCTPLHLAILNHKTDIAKLLLSWDADIAIKTQDGNSTLHIAALACNEEIITECLKKHCDINKLGCSGTTPLLCAMECKNPEIARLLIKNGADITIKNYFLQSALHLAAKNGLNELVLEYLSNGFDIDERNMFGETPLTLALIHFNLSTAKLLLSKGATIDIEVIDYKSTTLHLAAYCGYEDLVIECINKGCDVNKPNWDCLLPIDVANAGNKFNIVKILIDKGTIPSMHTIRSYVEVKVQTDVDVQEKIKYFKLLLNKLNNINTQDYDGNTILHHVCSSFHVMDSNERKLNSVETFHPQYVKILVHLGADYKIKNINEKSAYDLAVKNHQLIIVTIFDHHSSGKL